MSKLIKEGESGLDSNFFGVYKESLGYSQRVWNAHVRKHILLL